MRNVKELKIKLWSPAGDCHLGLTSGHTMIVPGARNGIDVPPQFRQAARMRGCLPVGIGPTLGVARVRLQFPRAAAKRAAKDQTELPSPFAPSGVCSANRDKPEPPEATVVLSEPVRCDDGGAGLIKRVIAELAYSGAAGATASRIRTRIGGRAEARTVRDALDDLWLSGAVTREKVGSRGRPREVWRLAEEHVRPNRDDQELAS